MKNIYIENTYSVELLARAFKLRSSLWSTDKLKDALVIKLTEARNYLKASRNGAFDHHHNWDCGRQDAFGDKVSQLFFELEALKIAYRISKGDGSLLKKHISIALGEV